MRRDGVTSSADTRHGEHRDSAPGLCELHRGGIGWGLGGVGRELGGGGPCTRGSLRCCLTLGPPDTHVGSGSPYLTLI